MKLFLSALILTVSFNIFSLSDYIGVVTIVAHDQQEGFRATQVSYIDDKMMPLSVMANAMLLKYDAPILYSRNFTDNGEIAYAQINALTCASIRNIVESEDDVFTAKSVTIDISNCKQKSNESFSEATIEASKENFGSTAKIILIK